MRCEVAHSVRGRLRVRYPAGWLARRREVIAAQVRTIAGVRRVAASGLTGSVRIDYDPGQLTEDALLDELRRLGPRLDGRPPRARQAPAGPEARGPAGAITSPVLALVGSSSALAALWLPVPTALATSLVLAAELPALMRAAAALQQRRIDGDVLEGATLVVLTARGAYLAAALLGWLRAVGEYVVGRGLVTTHRSLRELVIPPGLTAVRVEDGRRRAVAIATLRPGDVVVAESGAKLPVDGVVVDGEALINQQTMTGEALPVECRPGDSVFAATTVEHGAIHVRAERAGLDTTMGQIVTAVEAAADEKSELQTFAERLAAREVARTLFLAAIGAGLSRSLDAGTAVLAADYGLAARVGIPTALMTSIRRAVREGILVKGPGALENLARVDTVVFDKTGTLTSGTPRITRAISYDPDLDERAVVRLAAAAERGLRHPVARATARLAAEQGIAVPSAGGAGERPGLGVEVVVEGRRVLVGGRRFMESQEILLRAAARDEAEAHAVGASPTFVAVDARLVGLLRLEDELRPDAPAAVRALRDRQMRNVILLTGDHPEPARVIAESLGLRHHYADLLPEDKAKLIRELKREGRVVAMVGDGVNDALALREADVGIAVPGGAVVATEAADVVLLRGGLDRVVRALDLATEALEAVRLTLRVAGHANLVVGGLASLGFARPVISILLSHGATVAAAIATAVRPSRTSSGR